MNASPIIPESAGGGTSSVPIGRKLSSLERWGLSVRRESFKHEIWGDVKVKLLEVADKKSGVLAAIRLKFYELNHTKITFGEGKDKLTFYVSHTEKAFIKFTNDFAKEFIVTESGKEAPSLTKDFNSKKVLGMSGPEYLARLLTVKSGQVPDYVYLAFARRCKDEGYSDASIAVVTSGLKTYVVFIENALQSGASGSVSKARAREIDIEGGQIQGASDIAYKLITNELKEEEERKGVLVHQELFRRAGVDKIEGVSEPPHASDGKRTAMVLIGGKDLTDTYNTQVGSGMSPYIIYHDYLVGMAEVLNGLETMMKLGMIYLDFKPENIMVQEDGSCKLIDFGGSGLIPTAAVQPLKDKDMSVSERLQQVRSEIDTLIPNAFSATIDYCLPSFTREFISLITLSKELKSGRVGLQELLQMVREHPEGASAYPKGKDLTETTSKELIQWARDAGIPSTTIERMESKELELLLDKSKVMQKLGEIGLVSNIGVNLFIMLTFSTPQEFKALRRIEVYNSLVNQGFSDTLAELILKATDPNPQKRIPFEPFIEEFRSIVANLPQHLAEG